MAINRFKKLPKENSNTVRKTSLVLQDSTGKQTELPEEKKEREKLNIEGFRLVDFYTGEVVSESVKPMFESVGSYDEYALQLDIFIEAMSAKEFKGEKLEIYKESPSTIGEEKFDGHRALGFITLEGIRSFSKRISTKTGWFSENTDTMPHIRDFLSKEKREEMKGTILDYEITTDVIGSSSTDVQSITGAKPINALYSQIEDKGFVVPYIFDILYYKGVRLENAILAVRKLYAFKAFVEIDSKYIRFSKMYVTSKIPCEMFTEMNALYKVLSDGEMEEFKKYIIKIESFDEMFSTMLAMHKEGLMLKNLKATYVHKESDAFVKMKEHSTFDVIVTGFEPAEQYYSGKEIENPVFMWTYWENSKSEVILLPLRLCDAEKKGYKPLTRFFALGHIGAVTYGVYKNGKIVKIGRCSGMNDSERALITRNIESLVKEKAVMEVEAQGFSNPKTGTLRHPRFLRMRPDKGAEQCTFERHIKIKV